MGNELTRSIPDDLGSGGRRDMPDNITEYEDQQYESTKQQIILWHMIVEEDVNDPDLREGTRITGQFQAEEFTRQIGSLVGEGGGFSRTSPLIQWLGGKLETVTFRTRLFSEHSQSNTAANKLRILEKLNKSIAPLNRPPLVRFFWGRAIPGGMPCIVEDIGGVVYDDLRPDGTVRGAILSISLKRYTPYIMERAVVSPDARTPIYEVRAGDTYEMIAARKYGDPMLGVPLRQQTVRFPFDLQAPRHYADLEPNNIIKLLPKRDLDSVKIKPKSHIFDPDNVYASENRRRFFSLRGLKTGVIPNK